MRILTRKKQDEIIKRICANEIIFINLINDIESKDIECFGKYIDNSTEISSLVGGYVGAMKYLNTMEKYLKDKLSTVSEKEK